MKCIQEKQPNRKIQLRSTSLDMWRPNLHYVTLWTSLVSLECLLMMIHAFKIHTHTHTQKACYVIMLVWTAFVQMLQWKCSLKSIRPISQLWSEYQRQDGTCVNGCCCVRGVWSFNNRLHFSAPDAFVDVIALLILLSFAMSIHSKKTGIVSGVLSWAVAVR